MENNAGSLIYTVALKGLDALQAGVKAAEGAVAGLGKALTGDLAKQSEQATFFLRKIGKEYGIFKQDTRPGRGAFGEGVDVVKTLREAEEMVAKLNGVPLKIPVETLKVIPPEAISKPIIPPSAITQPLIPPSAIRPVVPKVIPPEAISRQPPKALETPKLAPPAAPGPQTGSGWADGFLAAQKAVFALSKAIGGGLQTALAKSAEDARALGRVFTSALGRTQTDLDALKAKLEATFNVKATLATLGTAFTQFGQQLQQMGNMGAAGFNRAIGFISKTVQVADPKGFEDMEVALFKLNLQLGRFFVPLLREATQWVEKLVVWMKGLSDSQREQVLHWTKIGLAITGVLSVLPRLFSMFSTGATVVRTFASAFTLLTASTPLGWILGIVAALGVLGALLGSGSGGTLEFANIWKTVQDTFAKVWEVLQPLVAALIEFGQSVLPLIANTFATLLGFLEPVVELLTFLATVVLKVMTTVVEGLSTGFGQFALVVGLVTLAAPLFATAWTGAITGVKAVWQGLTTWIMANPWTAIILGIVAAVGALAGAFGTVGDKIGEAAAKLDQFEATAQRLNRGGGATRQDVRNLTAAQQERLRVARNPDERRQVAGQIAQEEEGRLRQGPSREQAEGVAIRVQTALEQSNRETAQGQLFGVATRRREMLEQAGMSREQTRGIEGLGEFQLSGDAIRRITDRARAPRAEGESRAATARAIAEGREGDQGRFRGEMRQQPAQFTSIIDQWRQAMTSVDDTPEARRQREQLEQTTRGAVAAERTANATEQLAGRPPVGPPVAAGN